LLDFLDTIQTPSLYTPNSPNSTRVNGVTAYQLTNPIMSSFTIHDKVSGHEVKAWYLASLDLEVDTIDGEAAWASFMDHKPVDFKVPRRARGKKTSTPSCVDDAEKHEESKCDTRVYKGPSVGGWGCQCSSKKVEGQRLCKGHQNEADKHEGQVKNGFINEDRPTHHYGDENLALIPWHDVELPEKKKKTPKAQTSGEPKKQRKCGNCGEVGHNRKNCKNASSDSDKPETVADLMAKLAIAQAAVEAEAVEVAVAAEVAAEVVAEEVVAEELVAEIEQDEELDEDLTIGDEDDTGVLIDCTFEGVYYGRDPNDNEVVDDDGFGVGTWDQDNELIEFNKKGQQLHKKMKAAL
jgi:hypothetical protein